MLVLVVTAPDGTDVPVCSTTIIAIEIYFQNWLLATCYMPITFLHK